MGGRTSKTRGTRGTRGTRDTRDTRDTRTFLIAKNGPNTFSTIYSYSKCSLL